jgi:hypothetical protein
MQNIIEETVFCLNASYFTLVILRLNTDFYLLLKNSCKKSDYIQKLRLFQVSSISCGKIKININLIR